MKIEDRIALEAAWKIGLPIGLIYAIFNFLWYLLVRYS